MPLAAGSRAAKLMNFRENFLMKKSNAREYLLTFKYVIGWKLRWRKAHRCEWSSDMESWFLTSWRKKKMKRIVTMELWWLMKEHPSKPDDDSSISTSNSINKLNLIRELSLFPCCALVFGFDIDSHLLFYWRYNPKSSQIEFEGCWHYVFDRKYDISSRKW